MRFVELRYCVIENKQISLINVNYIFYSQYFRRLAIYNLRACFFFNSRKYSYNYPITRKYINYVKTMPHSRLDDEPDTKYCTNSDLHS